MPHKYLIKIFTQELQTKFNVECLKPLNDIADVHQQIIDFMGKNAIKWDPNPLQFTNTANGGEFYITYEEVTNGPEQNGIVRKENTTRVHVE